MKGGKGEKVKKWLRPQTYQLIKFISLPTHQLTNSLTHQLTNSLAHQLTNSLTP